MNAPLLNLSKFRFGSTAALFVATAFLFPLLTGTLRLQAQAPAAPAAAPSVAPSAAGPLALPSTQSGTTPRTGSQSSQSTAQTNGSRSQTDSSRTQDNTENRATTANTQTFVTQFQQLVATSTGGILPIFGESLFAGVPTTFAPVTDVPVTADYLIGPGDEITLQLSGQVNQQFDVTVDRTGNIELPELGTVHVTGIPFSQLNTYLKAQLGRIYRNFALNTNLGSLRTIQVFVVGEAVRPGSYTISSLSTLLNAVFASGGPLPDGSLRDIQVKRNGETVLHFDLYDLLLRGDKKNDIRLLSGDVIFIPFVGSQVSVAGSVNTPAIYELKGPTTINDVLKLAGGNTAVASGGALRLERVYEHSLRSIEDVNLATQGTQTVSNGDILSVSSILERFRNAVTLRGNVANPGRYVWHQAMRITEIIPNKPTVYTRN